MARRRRGRRRAKEDGAAAAAAKATTTTSVAVLSLLRDLAGEVSSVSEEEQEHGDLVKTLSREERAYFARSSAAERQLLAQLTQELRAGESADVPLRFRVLRSRLPAEVKRQALAKLARQTEATSSADAKFLGWLELALALPLGVRTQPRWNGDLTERLQEARRALDEAVHGHAAAKQAILERLFLWLVNPSVPQRPLGLVGPPGNGKTTLVQRGLAAAMGRPFFAVPLGGGSDASTLVGHGYTFEGSKPGRVAEALVSGGCEDPVLYFDELDKISGTPRGEELVNVLIHLTDTTQNGRFQDRYLHGLHLDVSGALMVFSFNDETLVSKVLLDRLQILPTDGFDGPQRRVIAQNFLLPELLRQRGLDASALRLSEDGLERLCGATSQDADNGGVRRLKAVLEDAVTKLDLWRRTGDGRFLYPLTPLDLLDGAPSSAEHVLTRAGVDKLLAFTPTSAGLKPPPPGLYV